MGLLLEEETTFGQGETLLSTWAFLCSLTVDSCGLFTAMARFYSLEAAGCWFRFRGLDPGSALSCWMLLGSGIQLLDEHTSNRWLRPFTFVGLEPLKPLKLQSHQRDCKPLRRFAHGHVWSVGLAGGGKEPPKSEHNGWKKSISKNRG